MSYVYPAPGAATATWEGTAVYAYPAAGAASATWVSGPAAPPSDGTASSIGTITTFGAPRVVILAEATGTSLTWLYGTANSTQQSPVVSLDVITNFGTPSHPALHEGDATGFLTGFMGRPIAGVPRSTPIVHRSLAVSGALMTVFGTATTLTQVSGQAAGNTTTALGTPGSRMGQMVQALAPTITFGAPATALGAYSSGFAVTTLGTPSATRIQPAASTYRATRWGTPGTERSDTYPARGLFNPARFAQPAARRLNAFAASGATSTQFGTPACYLRYRALHTAPTCRFGKPLMTWGTPC